MIPQSPAARSGERLSVLIDAERIRRRLVDLASEITANNAGREITVVAILHGSLLFAADLLRLIPLPLQLETLTVASYHGATASSGRVEFRQPTLPRLSGRHILLLDDILDTGRTLAAVRRRIETDSRPAGIEVCVLLEKRVAREDAAAADYAGFHIDDEFVVGYGLDYQGRFRNLPYIATLSLDSNT